LLGAWHNVKYKYVFRTIHFVHMCAHAHETQSSRKRMRRLVARADGHDKTADSMRVATHCISANEASRA